MASSFRRFVGRVAVGAAAEPKLVVGLTHMFSVSSLATSPLIV